MMEEGLISIKNRIAELNKLIQLKPVIDDKEDVCSIMDELDRMLYRYYKALAAQMRNIEGDGDGI